ncbi:TPA: hypothetical protein ACUUAG_001454 [Pseudomonas aeruginosa]|uniref:hypothetical protein n=1 Tax=Pseudomonas aeruginosa TaxID=287 RepID=UPI000F8611B5|nr:hypothetical protein [Pseudomonas aeruginosa]MCO2133005.1 hypothetical protein [Pseudomonas aeruginosa]MCT5277799.1 hypothetical protein [Pseudomonas aeruginosa]MCT5592858.1 hypothetical protein [Pseudomonas aeruginosa]MDP5967162.1 hypothetical protein [Pseudomonas aeruginosa]MDP5978831.1 hypothetical protein [Pseudomonas aeruginosa]
MDDETDLHIQLAYDVASSALEEANAANDLLVILLQAVMATQPEATNRFHQAVHDALNSTELIRSDAFENNARRLCGLIDGSCPTPYFNSLFPRSSGAPNQPKRPTLKVIQKLEPKPK